MEMMSEGERMGALAGILLIVLSFATALWVDGTNERMAQQGFMPLRLQGDTKVYWLPIPTERKSPELDGLLKAY
mgnify:CR=1 FL=1